MQDLVTPRLLGMSGDTSHCVDHCTELTTLVQINSDGFVKEILPSSWYFKVSVRAVYSCFSIKEVI